jgi:hypothetical protein
MRVQTAIAVLAGACALAGCGSSNKPAAVSTGDPGLAFARCMRAHGLTGFPDPGRRGEISIAPGSGVDPRSPVFQSAQRACQRLLPKGGVPEQMSASQRRAALAFAECMRANGVSSFPDPSQNAPTPGPGRPVLILRGMVFAPGPGVDPGSPAFRQAMTKCGVKPPPGPPPPS